jgi:hypothetical protein
VEVPVLWQRPVVTPHLDGAYPPYFVYGPLVFSTATFEFAEGLMSSEGPGAWRQWLCDRSSPLIKRFGDKPAFAGEGLAVVSSPFFPHKLAKGYSNPFANVVKSVNGAPIKNLGHLVEVLRDCKDEFVTFAFDSRYQETLVFRRAEMLAATDDILNDNGVRSQGSPDMLAVWKAKTAR